MIDRTDLTEPLPETWKPKSPKERVGTYLYFLSLYFVTVAVLYLWGYWSAFNINILEYLTLADIVKSTAFPIASAFGLVTLGVAFGHLTMRDVPPPRDGRSWSKIRKVVCEYPHQILAFYILITVAILIFGPIYKWYVLPPLLAIPPYLLASKQEILSTIIVEQHDRSIVLMLLAVLPTFAFGTGRMNAQYIIDGDRFDYVLSPIEQIQVPENAEPTKRLRFVGHAGDFLFFFEPVTSGLAISKTNNGQTLVLKHHPAPR